MNSVSSFYFLFFIFLFLLQADYFRNLAGDVQ